MTWFLIRMVVLQMGWLLVTSGAIAQTPPQAPPTQQSDPIQELKSSLGQGMQQVEDVRRKLEELAKPIQNILKGVADRDVLQNIDDLLHKSDWRLFWWVQLGALILILALRAVLLARTQHWARRLWIDVWTTAFYLVSLLVLVPMTTIGEPYRKLAKTAWDLYWAM